MLLYGGIDKLIDTQNLTLGLWHTEQKQSASDIADNGGTYIPKHAAMHYSGTSCRPGSKEPGY